MNEIFAPITDGKTIKYSQNDVDDMLAEQRHECEAMVAWKLRQLKLGIPADVHNSIAAACHNGAPMQDDESLSDQGIETSLNTSGYRE